MARKSGCETGGALSHAASANSHQQAPFGAQNVVAVIANLLIGAIDFAVSVQKVSIEGVAGEQWLHSEDGPCFAAKADLESPDPSHISPSS